MILFATKHKKYHLLYISVNQCITKIFKLIMILWDFSFKKTIKQPATLPIFFTSSIRTWLLLNPLEKVIFDNFFICNHLIIKWHFVGKRTKNYFLKWAHYWSFASFCPTHPTLQGALPIVIIPRALPWAKSFCPLPFRYAPVTVGSGRVEFTCENSILIRLQVKVGRNLEMYKNNKASQVYDLQGFAWCASRWAWTNDPLINSQVL